MSNLKSFTHTPSFLPDRNAMRGSGAGKKLLRGFTLIELLVVISIIGLLASVVLASLSSARDKARYAKAQSDLSQIIKAIQQAQGENGHALVTITGSGCSDCVCRNTDIRNISSGSTCYTQWESALNNIYTKGGSVIDIRNFTRDPWGSPYGLDENQGEAGNCTRADTLRSAGPDGVLYNSDDYEPTVPFSASCP